MPKVCLHLESDLSWKSWKSKDTKFCKFGHFELQLCHQRSPFKCKHTFGIFGHLVKKAYRYRFLKDGLTVELWQSPGGKWWLTHWASLLRWIWSISEYNLKTRDSRYDQWKMWSGIVHHRSRPQNMRLTHSWPQYCGKRARGVWFFFTILQHKCLVTLILILLIDA